MSKKRLLVRIVQIGAIALLVVVLLVEAFFLYPFWGFPLRGNTGPVPKTPAWALECWLWEDDVNTADAVQELLAGYESHDIPVRTILIDSPWSTRYNDFIVDEKRYPKPAEFFGNLQARGYRVVLWMTSMVNSENPDTAISDASDWYAEAARKGYLVGGDFQTEWWKGRGGFIDYTDPEAMQWWRGLQEQVLAWGIDGWKLDGSATLLHNRMLGIPLPFQKAHTGWITTRQYMDLYYREEYRHGLSKNPEFVTMSRSLDSPTPWAHPEGFAPLDASPVNWVGDNKHEWSDEARGLERAIRCILDSARLGYNVIGSDIGGYHGGKEIPPLLYIRWAQFSTFCGFFLNGGHGERRLWLRTPEELEIIRTYSWLHTELVPYMYTYVVQCHNGNKPLMRPLKEGTYQYLFGDYFLVAPLYTPEPRREIVFPEGQWRWWHDDRRVFSGNTSETLEFRTDQYPVFVREGAIIPMRIARNYTGIGDKEWADYLTWNIFPDQEGAFTVYLPDDDEELTLSYQQHLTELQVTVNGRHIPHILYIRLERPPNRVTLDGVELPSTAWSYSSEKLRLTIRTNSYAHGDYRIEL